MLRTHQLPDHPRRPFHVNSQLTWLNSVIRHGQAWATSMVLLPQTVQRLELHSSNLIAPTTAFYLMAATSALGQTTPGGGLEVNGNVKLTGSGASITFADGTVQSTVYTGASRGGDYAESVDVNGERVSYEPGDISVIDPIGSTAHHAHFTRVGPLSLTTA